MAREFGEHEPGPRCTAHSKRTGQPCQAYAVKGRTVCYIHGGNTPRGMASPHFKHGRYSKVLPSRLLERYKEAVQDDELLALREDVALVDARLADVLKRVDTGETGVTWQAAQKELLNLRIALQNHDSGAATNALNALTTLLGQGVADYAAWAAIGDLLEQRRRLVESERRRLIDMQQMLTAEQAMLLLAAVAETIRRHVTDQRALGAITADLERLVVVGAGASAQTG